MGSDPLVHIQIEMCFLREKMKARWLIKFTPFSSSSSSSSYSNTKKSLQAKPHSSSSSSFEYLYDFKFNQKMTNLNAEDMSTEKITVIFILGGPGSGKSTQSPKIAEKFGFVHISAGDLLREELKSGSEDSVMIQKTMENGELVPSNFMVKLLQRAMKESGKEKFLIDGFPRSLENLDAFTTLTGIEPKFVLYLYCSEEVMKQRLLKRNQGRNDDNIATITKRFEASKSVYPVIQFYHSLGKLYMIDARKSVDEVFEDINTTFHNWTKDSIKLIATESFVDINTIFHHCMDDSVKLVTTA
ncbi:hypothetical protein AQUCO_03500095v1 [Aquilegia coerulea]|uniref:adenylate kinase n=1 Tax=Aquilegia coerulea TaxID=218851 RepID=A0A2G5CW53_AQUCA|nr:hypothetical protein AQUCO_03500095v1 [Aquilegia coerulea]